MLSEINKKAEIHNIVAEIEKIRCQIENIAQWSYIIKMSMEQIYIDDRLSEKKYFIKDNTISKKDKDSHKSTPKKSCLYIGKKEKITSQDKKFINLTLSMELILSQIIKGNTNNMLFIHITSKNGITRGFPWNDFSVLPADFNPTEHCFFYLADQKHNPEKKEVWTEPYMCPVLKTWIVSCLVPLWINNKFLGVIGIDIDLGRILKPLGNYLSNFENAYAVIISPNRKLIVSSNEGMNKLREDKIFIGDGWSIDVGNQNNEREQIDIYEAMLTSGYAYIISTCLKSTNWNLACVLPKNIKSVDNQAALKSNIFIENELAKRNEGTGEYKPIVSFIASFSESMRQVEDLIEGIKMIGQGVLDYRIEVEPKDEIGLLALSINEMCEELKKRRNELMATFEKISQQDRLAALGTLAAGIAHEINNPLSVISNYIQSLLKNEYIKKFAQKEFLLIEEEIQRISNIINNLLVFSRQSKTEKSPVLINDLIRSTLIMLNFQLKSLSIHLYESYDSEIPYIFVDTPKIQQAFLNIFINSIQAMKNGGSLKIITQHIKENTKEFPEGSIKIIISDTGYGIEKQHINKIFDPFFTTKPVGQGTGLGLPISYSIIKDHGGIIEVESTPRLGTNFKIFLPIS